MTGKESTVRTDISGKGKEKMVPKFYFLFFTNYLFDFSHLPVETWTEVFDFCSRTELGKGISLASHLFNVISEALIHEQREHSLLDYLELDGSQDLPRTEVPKNTVAGQSYMEIRLAELLI